MSEAPVANLIRYVPSGTYFGRMRVGGKRIHQSLRTDKTSVAQLRLNDLVKEEREKLAEPSHVLPVFRLFYAQVIQ